MLRRWTRRCRSGSARGGGGCDGGSRSVDNPASLRAAAAASSADSILAFKFVFFVFAVVSFDIVVAAAASAAAASATDPSRARDDDAPFSFPPAAVLDDPVDDGVPVELDRPVVVPRDLAQIKNARTTVCGSNDSRDAVCYASSHREEYSRSRSVVRIRVRTSNSGVVGSSWCSGFLISRSNLLLTNDHCVGTDDAAANSDYEFGSESGGCDDGTNGRGRHGGRMKFRGGAALLKASRTMDYALLRLDLAHSAKEDDPSAEFGYLDLSPSAPSPGEALYVPHHPDGRAREISLFSSHPRDKSGLCEVAETNCCSVKYFCDTDQGSSGSPVLSRSSHEVETLHSSGDSGCDSGGNYGRIMGQIYDEIRDLVDECASDDDCVAPEVEGGGGDDSCIAYKCAGSPKRCWEDRPRKGCCGNGICEEGEGCRSCPLDCCRIHSLDVAALANDEDTLIIGHGVMFDIEVSPGSSSVDLLELGFTPHYGGHSDVSVHVRTGGGSYVGYENSSSEWTHLGTSSSARLSAGVRTAVPSSIVGRGRPLEIRGGSRLGIYVSSRASRVELLSMKRREDGNDEAAEMSDGHVAVLASAAVRGSAMGSLEVSSSSSDASSLAFVGRIVYHARTSAGGDRPESGLRRSGRDEARRRPWRRKRRQRRKRKRRRPQDGRIRA